MSFAHYAQKALLDHILKTAAFTQPTNLYVGLSTTAPADDGTNITEPSGNAYARVNHNAWNAATLATPSVATNNGAIAFPTPTGAWGNCTHFFVADASSGGNIIGSAVLDSARNIQTDQDVEFADTALAVTLT